jgi:hypothetical protein
MDQAKKAKLARLRVDISREDQHWLKVVAAKNGFVYMSDFVRHLIAEAIKDEKTDQARKSRAQVSRQ